MNVFATHILFPGVLGVLEYGGVICVWMGSLVNRPSLSLLFIHCLQVWGKGLTALANELDHTGVPT